MVKDRTLLAILIAAPLVVGGGAVKPVPDNPIEKDQTDEARFYTLKTHGNQRCDVVVVGDSRGLRAVSPGVLSEAMPGLRIFNFAYNAGGLNPEMYAQATARLDPMSRAPMILLAVTPLSMMTAKLRNEQYHRVLAKPRDERWLLLHAPTIARWLQPVKPAEYVRKALGIEPRTRYYQEFHDDGWIGSNKAPADTAEAYHEYMEELAGKSTDPQLVREFLNQTAAWTRAGVRVFGFRPPTTDDVVAVENRLLGFDEDALATAFAAAGGVWLRFANAPYQTYDGSHLRRESAIAFSRDLGEALRAHLQP